MVQVRGESIERWIGRPGVEIDVLFSNLRAHGSVRFFSTVSRGELGTTEDVEIVAASAVGGSTPIFGLTIRASGWRGGRERLGGRELPRTVEQFTELVGRVPMKNLVRETTDLIERLCIEAALELTRENRASAAEMLGLSRQAFYVKLRRYGLGDSGDGDVRTVKPALSTFHDRIAAAKCQLSLTTLTRHAYPRPMRSPQPTVVLELLKPLARFAPMSASACGVVSRGLSAMTRWRVAPLGIAQAGPPDPRAQAAGSATRHVFAMLTSAFPQCGGGAP